MFSKYTIGFIFLIFTVHLVKTKEFLDPHDKGDQVFLLAEHFTKLNTLLNVTEKLAQGLVNLNQRLDDLNQRQVDLENRAKSSMESLMERQDAILNKSGNLEQSLLNLTQRQETLENLIASQSPTWQTILRRQDGSVDFNRNWEEYEKGFGDPNGEFSIGLQQLHEMTTYGPTQELLVVLKDFEGETRYAKYDSFRVGNVTEKYALVEVGKYSGDAGDSLIEHKGYKFSTPGQDNDATDDYHCAEAYKSGWWFSDCYNCNLNGLYKKEAESKTRGVEWREWKEDISLKFAEMKIRSRM